MMFLATKGQERRKREENVAASLGWSEVVGFRTKRCSAKPGTTVARNAKEPARARKTCCKSAGLASSGSGSPSADISIVARQARDGDTENVIAGGPETVAGRAGRGSKGGEERTGQVIRELAGVGV